MTETTALLELENVTKRYPAAEAGADVLRGVTLRVETGDALAIVGPSGSGKSTLLNIVGALDVPTSGSVRLEGEDLAGLSPDALAAVRSRKIGFVFQSHHLLPQLTALENVLVPTLVAPAATDRRERARALLEQVGLGHRLTHRPGRLSGGECQRVAVVRALINEPRLLLADEPTGSLDAAASDDLGALLLRLNAEHGVSLVVVTHATTLAGRMRRVLELKDGRLAPAGVPA